MSENSEMTCAELADVAAELALGVLTGRERAMAVAHLDTCDACREEVRRLMATGERLIELLPPAEPPPGFETRVLARLGLPTPPPELPRQEAAAPRRIARPDNNPRHRRPAHGAARPGGDRPGDGRPGGGASARPGEERPGGARRPGRLRRALAAGAVVLAIVAAGLGGWRIGAGSTPPASTAAGPLTSASLLSATQGNVGKIFLYSGTPRWLYMAVDLGSGDETVTCQLVGADGRVSTLGAFRLSGGYGAWGSPAPGNAAYVTGARLVSPTGTVLATAAFTSW